MKIGIIGAGKLGCTIACRLLESGKFSDGIFVADRNAHKLAALEAAGAKAGCSNALVAQSADIVILCVKPKDIAALLDEIAGECRGKLVVSVAAGVSSALLQKKLPEARVVRCMPSIAASIGMSQTGVHVPDGTNDADRKTVEGIFGTLGECHHVQESQIACWTSVCASGPAFLVKAAQAGMEEEEMLSCMQKALCREKFEEGFAGEIARKVLHATKKLMLSSGESGEEFVARVASKKGTTEAGLEAGGNFSREENLDAAFEAAKNRAQEIEKGF